MASSSLARWLPRVVSAIIVLLAARPASAAAPICDERGLSAIAPSPVLPIRDVRLEAGGRAACGASGTSMTPAGPRARSRAIVLDAAADDACLDARGGEISRDASARAPHAIGPSLSPRPGHGRAVFRPPRP